MLWQCLGEKVYSMSVYMIIESKVKDQERYSQYISRVPEIISKYGGRYLVRGGKITALWGGWLPERMIILEFPSEDNIRQWLSSSEYQAISPLREAGADTRVVLVEGYGHEPEQSICP
jgi:uncharacterized protein (DUF1330 family)